MAEGTAEARLIGVKELVVSQEQKGGHLCIMSKVESRAGGRIQNIPGFVAC